MKTNKTISLNVETVMALTKLTKLGAISNSSSLIDALIQAWIQNPMVLVECDECGTIFFYGDGIECDTEPHCPECTAVFDTTKEELQEEYLGNLKTMKKILE